MSPIFDATDTDSVFIKLNKLLINQGVDIQKWNTIDQDIKIKLLLKLSKNIEDIVNDRCYYDVQLNDYNSIVQEDDFSIKLKQEIICSNALFIAPKMYCYHIINDEGYDCDKIDAKGVEIVRSSAPTIFRNALKKILERLLKGDDDSVLSGIVEEYKDKFYDTIPEDISVNIGVNNLDKYINEDNHYLKGTPYHIKATSHYHCLLDEFDINQKYERIKEGDKIRLVYIKKNKWGFDTVGYYKWPVEFDDNDIQVDYDKMIEKYFINKAKIILDPINKTKILDDDSIVNLFF